MNGDQQPFTAQGFRQFRQHLFNRLYNKDGQKSLYRLRRLNKECNQHAQKKINTTKIDISNLETLSKSNVNQHIQFLYVSVGKHLKYLDELRFVSPDYFPNIQKVIVVVTDDGSTTTTHIRKIIRINQPFFIRGLHVVGNWSNKMTSFRICGYNNDITIVDSEFVGVNLHCGNNADVLIQQTRFLNSAQDGFSCRNCNSLRMESIVVKNTTQDGCFVDNCEKVVLSDMHFEGCGDDGIALYGVPDFSVQNACIQNGVGGGIYVNTSVGKIRDILVYDCKEYGIQLQTNSIVRYSNFQSRNNQENSVIGVNSGFSMEV